MKKGKNFKRMLPLAAVALVVVIVAAISFFQGNEDQRDNPISGPEVILERGGNLYAQYCLSCHGGQEAQLVFGQPPPHNGAGHTWHHSDIELKKWTLDGKPYNMPAFEATLKGSDVDVILAYIKTWWSPEQRETQANISKQYEKAVRDYQNNQEGNSE